MSPRPGDGVANRYEDAYACEEDTDRSLALSAAEGDGALQPPIWNKRDVVDEGGLK